MATQTNHVTRTQLEKDLRAVLARLNETWHGSTLEYLAVFTPEGAETDDPSGLLAVTHVVIRPDGQVVVGIIGKKFLRDPLAGLEKALPQAVVDSLSFRYSTAVIKYGWEGEWVENGWALSFQTQFLVRLPRLNNGRVDVANSAILIEREALDAASDQRSRWQTLEERFRLIGHELDWRQNRSNQQERSAVANGQARHCQGRSRARLWVPEAGGPLSGERGVSRSLWKAPSSAYRLPGLSRRDSSNTRLDVD